MKGKFYGPKKIKSSDKAGGYIMLTFSDDSKVRISELIAENTVTDKACTLTDLRDKRLQPVAEKMLEMYLEYDIKVSELDFLTSLIITSLNDNLEKATDKLWGVTRLEKTFSDINSVLKD